MQIGDLAIVRNVSTGAPSWVRDLYQTRAPVLIVAESRRTSDIWILHKGKRYFIQKSRLRVLGEARASR
jgi:hypothetical protein|tara:strand:+ start:10 stop:216 length:207 start_codon:yes stop_codon:yes gene_type:complete